MPDLHSQWLPEGLTLETRKTFVLWVSREPAADSDSRTVVLDGRMEEVDTGRELRFRSGEQLLAFLEECLKKEEEK